MKIIIVDDEALQANYLHDKLKAHYPEAESVDIYNSPKDALIALRKNNFDLIFLDIEMPEMNGFEFIEIAGVATLPPIIFTTAFSDYAVEAFKVNAIDYLLKPIDPEELKSAIAKVGTRNNPEKSLSNIIDDQAGSFSRRLILVDQNSYEFVDFDKIIRIEGQGSYSSFFLEGNVKITTSKNLNFYWKKLSEHGFIRTHQSHIVNKNHIVRYNRLNRGELVLAEKQSAPISSRLRQAVKEQLGLS